MSSSPLGRTRETARIVCSVAALPEPTFDDRLQEHGLGCWEGLTWTDVEAGWPERLVDAHAHNWYFRSPDGEAIPETRSRATAWLTQARGRNVVITHGLIGRFLRGIYAGLDETTTLSLPVPQDVVWHLHDGVIDAILV